MGKRFVANLHVFNGNLTPPRQHQRAASKTNVRRRVRRAQQEAEAHEARRVLRPAHVGLAQGAQQVVQFGERLAGEPLRQRGAYDFGASDLFARSFEQGRAQFFGEGYARTPPADLLFLQKVAGNGGQRLRHVMRVLHNFANTGLGGHVGRFIARRLSPRIARSRGG